jgi:hypothetical protein
VEPHLFVTAQADTLGVILSPTMAVHLHRRTAEGLHYMRTVAYKADTLAGGGLLCNYYFNFSPRILRFTGPTTHRSKQEKIPQGANELKFGFRA